MKALKSVIDDYLENLNLHYSDLNNIDYKDEFEARELLKTLKKMFHGEMEQEINLAIKNNRNN